MHLARRSVAFDPAGMPGSAIAARTSWMDAAVTKNSSRSWNLGTGSRLGELLEAKETARRRPHYQRFVDL
jgi:hypothetical protein